MKHSFIKKERLTGRSLISTLFADGHTFYLFPFRVTWMSHPSDGSAPVQVVMSVPKYNFPKSTCRNLIRRRIKESYRLNKNILCETLLTGHQQILVCIHYTAKEILAFELIQGKIILLLQRLKEENEKVTG